jgi:hypothetical protein
MRRSLFGVLFSLALPDTVVGQTPTPPPCPACLTYYHNAAGKTYLIEDVGLDRDEAARTILLNTAAHDQLYLVIFYTYSTATEVFVKVSCSRDGTEPAPLAQETLLTDGSNQRYLLTYDVKGCKSTRVLFGGSSDANSADVITVQAIGQSTGPGGKPGNVTIQ